MTTGTWQRDCNSDILEANPKARWKGREEVCKLLDNKAVLSQPSSQCFLKMKDWTWLNSIKRYTVSSWDSPKCSLAALQPQKSM